MTEAPPHPPSVAGHRVSAREVRVGGHSFSLVEVGDMDALIDARIATDDVAPYGAVLWPTALAVSEYLLARGPDLTGRRVVDVGAGTGLCALVAARLGADVIALDHDPLTRELLLASAAACGLRLDVAPFDLGSDQQLPEADLFVFADVLYEEALAIDAARRVWEALGRGAEVVVGDPGRVYRTAFIDTLASFGAHATFTPRTVLDDGEIAHTIGVAVLGAAR